MLWKSWTAAQFQNRYYNRRTPLPRVCCPFNSAQADGWRIYWPSCDKPACVSLGRGVKADWRTAVLLGSYPPAFDAVKRAVIYTLFYSKHRGRKAKSISTRHGDHQGSDWYRRSAFKTGSSVAGRTAPYHCCARGWNHSAEQRKRAERNSDWSA